MIHPRPVVLKLWSATTDGYWLYTVLCTVEQSAFFNLSVTSPTSQLILQPFRRFTYVTAHSPTLPSLYPRHSSFSNTSVASPTSQFILQPFFRFSCITSSSLNSPDEPLMTECRLSVTLRYYECCHVPLCFKTQ